MSKKKDGNVLASLAKKISENDLRLSEDGISSLKRLTDSMEQVKVAFGLYQVEFKKIPDSIKYLAKMGWYIPFDFHPAEINNLVANQNWQESENQLIKLLDEELSINLKLIETRYPSRINAINSAVKAHKCGEYYLSIPVFFAQTEGICLEILEKPFFKERNGKPATEKWATSFQPDTIIDILVLPLKDLGEIRKPYNPQNDNTVGLNRHAILHGACNDYGENHINSYKALSLLLYIAITIFEIVNWHNKKK